MIFFRSRERPSAEDQEAARDFGVGERGLRSGSPVSAVDALEAKIAAEADTVSVKPPAVQTRDRNKSRGERATRVSEVTAVALPFRTTDRTEVEELIRVINRIIAGGEGAGLPGVREDTWLSARSRGIPYLHRWRISDPWHIEVIQRAARSHHAVWADAFGRRDQGRGPQVGTSEADVLSGDAERAETAGDETGIAGLPPLASLTERQHEVLVLVVDGLSNHEIASRLELSYSQVKTHVRTLMRKLDARSRTGLIVKALKSYNVKS